MVKVSEFTSCISCKEIKKKYRDGFYTYFSKSKKVQIKSYYYIDENGLRWSGNKCPKCSSLYAEKRNRRLGHKSQDDVTFAPHKKGRDAERLVFNTLVNMGFCCEINKKYGPDVIIKNPLGGKDILVEVKTTYSRSHCIGSLLVDRIKESRKNDDIMAIVFDNGYIHFEEMKSHLDNCNKDGFRTVTRLAQ